MKMIFFYRDSTINIKINHFMFLKKLQCDSKIFYSKKYLEIIFFWFPSHQFCCTASISLKFIKEVNVCIVEAGIALKLSLRTVERPKSPKPCVKGI